MTTFPQHVTDAAHTLMKHVLNLKDQRFIDATQVRRIASDIGLTSIEEEIYFLRELHGICRRLPLKIFGDDEDRLRLVAGVQEALDAAIDQEEEELEFED